MKDLFTQADGWTLLAFYAVSMIVLTMALNARSRTKDAFLVAGRDISPVASGMSIAATWIWAPALFIAAQKAYEQGVAGLFWFTVPNVLCLVVFAWFAGRIRQEVPRGYTLSEYMSTIYSPRVQAAYLFQFSALAVCSFAVQLLAGAAALSIMTGIPFWAITVALGGIALSYSLWSGIRASVVTGYAQMVIILAVAVTVVPWAVSEAGGWSVVAAGIGGRSGQFTNVFDPTVALAFGLPVTIGLMSGPFGDQSFWQRAFSTREDSVGKAFLIGAAAFAVVPLTLSIPGFLAAGMGYDAASPQMVNLEIIVDLLPAWVAIPFTFMLLSGLVSTLDGNLCAVSSLVGHDAVRRWLPVADPLKASRWAMIALAVGGVAIANIPGLTILLLFLFYGTLRSSTLMPTVLTLCGRQLSERGVFWGIVVAIACGLPVFAYGNFGGGLFWTVAGSLGTVLSSGIIALAVTAYDNITGFPGDPEPEDSFWMGQP